MSDANKGIPLKPLLLNFLAKHGFSEEELAAVWKRKLPTLSLDDSPCEVVKELTEDDARDYHVKLPAILFQRKRHGAAWLVSTEEVIINKEPRTVLLMTTVSAQKMKGFSPSGGGGDPQRFLGDNSHRGSTW